MTKNAQNPAEPVDTEKAFIPYPKAMMLLQSRINATPEELAAWIFLGPDAGGLNAYLHANELDPPPPFSLLLVDADEYLSCLMGCWFNRGEVMNFQPSTRFITGRALLDRWSELPNIPDLEAYVVAKIEDSRLREIHPTHGGTQASFGDENSEIEYPPLEEGLFPVDQIERVEREEFGIGVPDPEGIAYPPKGANETPAERVQRLKIWLQSEIEDNGKSGAITRVAKREGISRQRVSEILKKG